VGGVPDAFGGREAVGLEGEFYGVYWRDQCAQDEKQERSEGRR
jgi:hypothetical protein